MTSSSIGPPRWSTSRSSSVGLEAGSWKGLRHGVATVTLQPVRLISPPASVNPRRFGTSTTSVHDNIAAYRFTVPYVQDPRQKSLVYAVTVVARATWRDRYGTVIAQTTTRLQLWLKVRGNNGPITATN